MEHLDAAVVRVGHGHDPTRANIDIYWTIKLAGAPTRPDHKCERTVGIEHLDAAIALVRHGHEPAGTNGDIHRAFKLAEIRSM